jgi:hypothetical protein
MNRTPEQGPIEGPSAGSRLERRAGIPKRRIWLQRVHRETRFTPGCKAWLGLLSDRSDDLGKPVWGSQKKMGVQLGVCRGSVGRFLAEAEGLGYIAVYRPRPVRGPGGRYVERRTNRYYLRIPPATDDRPAPRHRVKAGYCVTKNRRSDLARTDVARTRVPQPPEGSGVDGEACSDLETGEIRTAAEHLAAMRASLAAAGHKQGR